jgi:hypothetical protein
MTHRTNWPYASSRRRLQLSQKQEKELDRLGPSKELTDRHFQESKNQAEQFDKERGRYASEFLDARRIVQELDQREKEKSLEPGKGYER